MTSPFNWKEEKSVLANSHEFNGVNHNKSLASRKAKEINPEKDSALNSKFTREQVILFNGRHSSVYSRATPSKKKS